MTRKQSEARLTWNATNLSSWLHSVLDQLELTLASDEAKGSWLNSSGNAEILQSGYLPDAIPSGLHVSGQGILRSSPELPYALPSEPKFNHYKITYIATQEASLELVQRLICYAGNIPLHRLQSGIMYESEWDGIAYAISVLEKRQVTFMQANPNLTHVLEWLLTEPRSTCGLPIFVIEGSLWNIYSSNVPLTGHLQTERINSLAIEANTTVLMNQLHDVIL